MSKECNKCKTEKSISNFCKNKKNKDGLNNVCKECVRKQAKEWRINNKEKKKAYDENWRTNNKDKIAELNKNWIKNNREKKKEYESIYNKENKEKIKNRRKLRDKSNKKKYDNSYQKKKRSSDPLYKLKRNMRSSISHAFSKRNIKKNTKTEKIISCTWEEFESHLENTCKINYGCSISELKDYHIDHIVPLAKAKTEEEVIKLNHYTNFQILTKEDNLEKGDSLDYKSPYQDLLIKLI